MSCIQRREEAFLLRYEVAPILSIRLVADEMEDRLTRQACVVDV